MSTQRQISVKICLGSACYTRGSQEIVEALKEYIAAQHLESRVQLIGSLCEDLCRKGPIVTIDGRQHTGVDATSVVTLLETYLK
jgi:NADH:ubiquinone oxidoreductase subunit E